MTSNLIPQDELTLDLLAQVLAKMYCFYLSSKHDVSGEVFESESDVPSTKDLNALSTPGLQGLSSCESST